jgi:hypothetical protein
MARRFRFKVREGHQIHSFSDEGTETHGAGYEFLLTESEAAELFRNGGHRKFDVVEVNDEEHAEPERGFTRL